MEGLASKLKLSDPELQKRAETVPLLLKGRIIVTFDYQVSRTSVIRMCVTDFPCDMFLV